MTTPRQSFADRLLAADPSAADARDRHQREVRAMIDRTLTRGQRWEYLVGAVGLLALSAFLGAAVAFDRRPPDDVMPYVVAYVGATAAACFLAAAPLLRGYWTGTVRRSGDWVAGVGVAYIGLIGWVMMLMARAVPEPLRDDARVFGLVLLIYAAVAWTRHRIAQAESRTIEKLLELELRLAEMSEAKEDRLRPSGPGTSAT